MRRPLNKIKKEVKLNMAKALSFDKFKEVLKKIKANEDKIESKVDDLTLYSGYTANDIYVY